MFKQSLQTTHLFFWWDVFWLNVHKIIRGNLMFFYCRNLESVIYRKTVWRFSSNLSVLHNLPQVARSCDKSDKGNWSQGGFQPSDYTILYFIGGPKNFKEMQNLFLRISAYKAVVFDDMAHDMYLPDLYNWSQGKMEKLWRVKKLSKIEEK